MWTVARFATTASNTATAANPTPSPTPYRKRQGVLRGERHPSRLQLCRSSSRPTRSVATANPRRRNVPTRASHHSGPPIVGRTASSPCQTPRPTAANSPSQSSATPSGFSWSINNLRALDARADRSDRGTQDQHRQEQLDEVAQQERECGQLGRAAQ